MAVTLSDQITQRPKPNVDRLLAPGRAPLFSAGDPFPRFDGFWGGRVGRLSALHAAYPQGRLSSCCFRVPFEEGTFSEACFWFFSSREYDPSIEKAAFHIRPASVDEVRRQVLAAFGHPDETRILGFVMVWKLGGCRVELAGDEYEVDLRG